MSRMPRGGGAHARRALVVVTTSLLGLYAGLASSTGLPAEHLAAGGQLDGGPVRAAGQRLVAGYGSLPIRFEPNLGQAAARTKYLAHGEGYDIALSTQGISLNAADGASLHLRPVRANAAPQLRAERRQASFSNYFIGSDRSKWHSKIANYGAVRYRQVYPGVDWLVYGNPRQLEYDFVLVPQADPRRIRLGFEGAGHLALDGNGDLLVDVGGHTLRQLKPVLYQIGANGKKQSVEGRYVLHQQQLAFAVGRYDHGRELVIDPAFAYSTYLGGSRSTNANAIAVDSAGNAYIAGNTGATDFPTAHPYQGGNNGGNAFIAKLSADGSGLVYSTYLGGSGGENAAGIAVDSAGNAYIAGSTYSTDFPLANAYQSSNKAAGTDTNESAFVAKLSADGGSLVYSTYLGGSNDLNGASGLALDRAGSAYLVGSTNSTDFPTARPLQAALSGRLNAYITKFSADGGSLVYSTYLGGTAADNGVAIAVDGSGSAYITGLTNSTDFPTVNAFQSTYNSGDPDFGSNAYLSKLKPDGSALLYSTYLGGSGFDVGDAIAVDSAGSAYVAGLTADSDFPTQNPYQSTNQALAGLGGSAGFVTKFSADGGSLVYSTYLSGSGGGNGIIGDAVRAIAVDGAGHAYVAGEAASVDFPAVNAVQKTNAAAHIGATNAFITELNAAGTALLSSTYLGGSASFGNAARHSTIPDGDFATGIAVDSTGGVYVAGRTGSADFPTVKPFQAANATKTQYGTSYSAFSSKYVPVPQTVPTGLVATAGDGQVSLSWTATGDASSYNVYQATAAGGEGSTPIRADVTYIGTTITGLSNGTTYYFAVTAVGGNGESLKSNEASATPQAASSSSSSSSSSSGSTSSGSSGTGSSSSSSSGGTTSSSSGSTSSSGSGSSSGGNSGGGGGGAAGWGLLGGLGLGLAARRRRNASQPAPRQGK